VPCHVCLSVCLSEFASRCVLGLFLFRSVYLCRLLSRRLQRPRHLPHAERRLAGEGQRADGRADNALDLQQRRRAGGRPVQRAGAAALLELGRGVSAHVQLRPRLLWRGLFAAHVPQGRRPLDHGPERPRHRPGGLLPRRRRGAGRAAGHQAVRRDHIRVPGQLHHRRGLRAAAAELEPDRGGGLQLHQGVCAPGAPGAHVHRLALVRLTRQQRVREQR
jgi:hypothetical protein